MLDPDHRILYSDALRPPPGFRFRQAIATTYSLDLQRLLTIPLHLALFSADQPLEELLKDGVALLEALRRTTKQVTIYTQMGRVLAPTQPHVLYGLLEPSVVQVMPPAATGSFHPKLWVIQFENVDSKAVALRLLVLSRNITDDRCWDLALTLDGKPESHRRPENEPLSALLKILPGLAVRPVEAETVRRTRSLADLAYRSRWELPGGFSNIRFHAFGLAEGNEWLPDPSDRLVVISPFVSNAALRKLLASSNEPLAIISRPEELAGADTELLERFQRRLTLAEEAEREDGEEPAPRQDHSLPVNGLHAKAYLAKRGWNTHVYVGSANATNPALVYGTNVEFMAELIGRRSQVGSVDALLDADGFGAVLTDYLPGDDPIEVDPAMEAAQLALEAGRRELAEGELRLRFAPQGEGIWTIALTAARSPAFTGIGSVRAWLATRDRGTAEDLAPLRLGEPVAFPPATVAHLTTFVVFELSANDVEGPLRFVLSVESDSLPAEERDSAVVRDVIRNRDGFLRYVMLLLAQVGEGSPVFGQGGANWARANQRFGFDDHLPLFENLTRAFCRDPERLRSIQRLLSEMGIDEAQPPELDRPMEGVVPPEFLALWQVFRDALGETKEGAR